MHKTHLSPRESQVLHLIAHEYTCKEIALLLNISCHTAISHRKNLMTKLAVKNAAGMVRRAFELGIMHEFYTQGVRNWPLLSNTLILCLFHSNAKPWNLLTTSKHKTMIKFLQFKTPFLTSINLTVWISVPKSMDQ